MLKRFNNNSLVLLYSIFMLVASVSHAWGWDNDSTHQDLSKSATNQSVLNYGYLTSNLGIQGGVDSILHWGGAPKGPDRSVLDWIIYGANTEDNFPRFLNHFHDPLKNAALSDFGFMAAPVSLDSALVWAKDPVNQGGVYYQDDWSWQTTKQHYYNSLTFFFKEGRDAELAQTFYGLGHLVHLLQDMSQPAHVRNDFHLDDYLGMRFDQITATRAFELFENWAKWHTEANDYIYNRAPIFPDFSPTSGIQLYFDSFWDTDTYNGTSQISRGATNIGLAEYTNSNFFSDDTINTSLLNPGDYLLHNYPFPSKDTSTYFACFETQPLGGLIPDAIYYGRSPCDMNNGGIPTDHFFKGSLLNIGSFQLNIPWYTLDDKVYNDYAKDLLPRAVGYSASFINYFFRGTLVLEGAGTNQFTIGNRSTDTLNSGTLSVYYDNTADNRILLGNVSVNNPIATGQSSDIGTFNPPSGVSYPPTDNKVPGSYWIVFNGKLEGEEGAVIGSYTGNWKEEWDKGLFGRHNWFVLPIDAPYTVPGGSMTTVDNLTTGNLEMTNTRPAGTSATSTTEQYYIGAQENDVFIGTGESPAVRDIFPITFDANTIITFKVNNMTSSFPNPMPILQCAPGDPFYNRTWVNNWPAAWQVISFSFDNGGTSYVMDLTVPGQGSPYANVWLYLSPGADMYFSPYQIMQSFGVTIVPPLKLESIDISQQIWGLCNGTSTTTDNQSMSVDYIRIQESSP